MWVPVRFKFSRRKSTSNVRGSTSASRGSPFTRTRTVIFSATDIFVSCLHTLTAGTPQGDCNRAFHQRSDQGTLIVRGTAHITLRFRCFPRRLGAALSGWLPDPHASQRCLCLIGTTHGSTPDTTTDPPASSTRKPP